jgi:phospholipase C
VTVERAYTASGALLAALTAFVGCAGQSGTTPPAASRPALDGVDGPSTARRLAAPDGQGQILHVVVVVQENRSFDNLFNAYPGANTAQSGINSHGQTVPLTAIPFTVPYDIVHGVKQYADAWDNGRMDGFDKQPITIYQQGYTPPPNPQFGYVPQSQAQTYWNMAGQYVLADNMFASNIDGSFEAHQFLIAGQSYNAGNNPSITPWGCDSSSNNTVGVLNSRRQVLSHMFPCFPNAVGAPTYPTLADQLDAKSISWKYYAPVYLTSGANGYIWSAFDAVNAIRNGPDWTTHVISPPATVIGDARNNQLPSMVWVAPTLTNSDHSDSRSVSGPAWVASIVNAIGQSPAWSTTAIFVVWDDWGGWYDHVNPPQIDFDGLGFRVPLLVISPYAKAGYVSHVQYEFGSILRFAETEFGLTPMAASDLRANRLGPDCFDFTQSPRPYTPFALPRGMDFPREKPDYRIPDTQ